MGFTTLQEVRLAVITRITKEKGIKKKEKGQGHHQRKKGDPRLNSRELF